MPLDDETASKIAEHLNAKWKTIECLLCGENEWALNAYISLLIGDEPNTVTVGGKSLPCVAVVCKNCGNTILVNAFAIGIAPK